MDKKILLVEDEAMIRDMYEMILKKKGYPIDIAEDGEIALNKLNQAPDDYGLILLDIMLPKIDGISVLKKAKQSDQLKDIPVFLLTNLGQENLIKEAMSLGAVQYWIKSNIFPMDLIKEIENFLNSSGETGKSPAPSSSQNQPSSSANDQPQSTTPPSPNIDNSSISSPPPSLSSS